MVTIRTTILTSYSLKVIVDLNNSKIKTLKEQLKIPQHEPILCPKIVKLA